MDDVVKELKSKFSQYCLFGKCFDCSRLDKNGRGIHDVEVYQVYEYTEKEECGRCDGRGYRTVDCPHCDGMGEVDEKCEDCKGKGKQPDLAGDKELIREETQLVEKTIEEVKDAKDN